MSKQAPDSACRNTKAASRRRGHSSTTPSSRTTRRPSGSSTCTALAARIRSSRRRFRRIRILPWRTSRIAELGATFAREGLHPFHLPLGVLLEERNGIAAPTSPWFRNNAFDGFPCLLNGKADAQVMCVDPMLDAHANVTLLTNACATRLDTNPSGRTLSVVEVVRDGRQERYSADIVVVACGALNSALLLLRSVNDRHPRGLANGSDQVGRNYLRHNQSVLMALAREPNDTVFQKALGLSDFYFGADDCDYPLGLILM